MLFRNIPSDGDQLIELGENNEIGLAAYAQALKISSITAAQVGAQVAAFTVDNNAYNAGRTVRQAASNVLTAANQGLAAWITDVKNVLVGSFGPSWSSEWVQVGFVSPSVAVPTTLSKQWALAGKMIAFLTANPAYEVPAEVTAAEGTARRAAISAAQVVFTEKDMAMKDLTVAWDTTYGTLLGTLKNLLKLLQGLNLTR